MRSVWSGIVFTVATTLALGCVPKVNRLPGGGGGKGGQDAAASAPDLSEDTSTGGSGGGTSTPDLSGVTDDGCPASSPTAVAGRVFAPNGKLPLYNATVYVPSGPPPELKEGVSCDRCGNVAAHALAVTQTDASGGFKLAGALAGTNVQLVLEMGKWRRILTVPEVKHCQTVMLPEDQTRLPRSHTEGNMPKLAIATGAADPFECLLLKIGIDKTEFTAPSGTGKVHFYQGATQPGTKMASAVPKEDDATDGLYVANRLAQYDVVLLPCEGKNTYDKTTDAQRALLVPYLDAGGRLFSTHYSYNWLTYTNSPYNVVGKWNADQLSLASEGTLDVNFPKGKAFAEWLHNVDKTVNGSFTIVDPRYDIDSVDPMYAQRWIHEKSGDKPVHLTFNTPLKPPVDKDGKPQYCGRVVFSDFHVSATALQEDPMTHHEQIFPDACKMEEMTTQEKALAFMLFDLSSCVIPDTQPPIP